MAGKRYPMELTRLQVRQVWTDVQSAIPANRTHEEWLAAANRELEKYAEVVIGVTKIQLLEMKQPDEVLNLRLSYEAAAGCKISLVQAAKGAAFRKRCAVREIADGFGEEFSKLVRKATALEDSKDLQEDSELKGVPFEEDEETPPAAAAEVKKES